MTSTDAPNWAQLKTSGTWRMPALLTSIPLHETQDQNKKAGEVSHTLPLCHLLDITPWNALHNIYTQNSRFLFHTELQRHFLSCDLQKHDVDIPTELTLYCFHSFLWKPSKKWFTMKGLWRPTSPTRNIYVVRGGDWHCALTWRDATSVFCLCLNQDINIININITHYKECNR